MLVQLSDVHFGYPGVELLSGVTWQIDPGCRVGLVGPNGAGKSSLLRIIAGVERPDAGTVSRHRDCRIGYLRQSSELRGTGTLLEALLAPFARTLELRARRKAALERLEAHPEDTAALEAYGHAQHEYEQVGGDALEHRIRELVADLGLSEADLDRPLNSFSGGEIGRVELARVLVEEPDLLLLDEPTNHLDIRSTEALERRLQAFRGGVVLVSHDRAFLNALCREMVEIAGGRLERFRGNFDAYRAERQARASRLRAEIARQQQEVARLQDYIARNQAGLRARQARSRKRALGRIEKIEIPEDPWARSEGMRFRFAEAEHRGSREMVRIEGMTLQHGDAPPLVSGLDLVIERGDRLGIVGPNGSGKTTLLKALVGAAPPTAGTVTVGKQVRLGWFDQQRSDLHEELTLIEEIRTVRADLSLERVRSILGALRFGDDEVYRPVSSLSGGERSRLALGKLAMTPYNLLALDEPTNHLDIPAREALEEGIRAYGGTLVVVSHDRYFLDQVASKILWFGPQGVTLHWGRYSEVRERLARQGVALDGVALDGAALDGAALDGAAPTAGAALGGAQPTAGAARTGAQPRGAVFAGAQPQSARRSQAAEQRKRQRAAERERERQAKRQRERDERRLAALEETISRLESDIARLDDALAAGGQDWEALQRLTEERQELEAELEAALAEWEEVGRRLETRGQGAP